MHGKKRISLAEAERIGDILSVDWNQILVKQFCIGLEVELDNRTAASESTMTEDDILVNGKIALAHLIDFPEHYTHLASMEKRQRNIG